MKKNWFSGIALAMILVVATLLSSCGAFFGNGNGNVTINLPPVSSASRAISADLIDDIKGSVTSYRVTVNANGNRTTKSGNSGNFSFAVPVGTKIEITVECLFGDEVMVRAVKTHTVTAGANDIRINLRQDGEALRAESDNNSSVGEAPLGADEFYFEFVISIFNPSNVDGNEYFPESPTKLEDNTPQEVILANFGNIRVRDGDNVESTIRNWHSQYRANYTLTSIKDILLENSGKSAETGRAPFASEYQKYDKTTFSKSEMEGKNWLVVIEEQ